MRGRTVKSAIVLGGALDFLGAGDAEGAMMALARGLIATDSAVCLSKSRLVFPRMDTT